MSEVKKGNGLVYKNHPLRRIDNLTCRIQILYDIIMFQQISRTVSRHDDFPRCGTIGHHIHRTIHD